MKTFVVTQDFDFSKVIGEIKLVDEVLNNEFFDKYVLSLGTVKTEDGIGIATFSFIKKENHPAFFKNL